MRRWAFTVVFNRRHLAFGEASGELGGELIVVSILPHSISIQCIAHIFYDILYKVLIRAAAQEEEKRLT